LTKSIPTLYPGVLRIATTDGNVVALDYCLEEGREDLGRVLQIGVHHPEQIAIGMGPSVHNGAGEALLIFSDEEADAGIASATCERSVLRAIYATIVHYDDFVINANWIKRGLNARDQRFDISRFVQSRDYECEFVFVISEHIRNPEF
jgi:hypothetical protein